MDQQKFFLWFCGFYEGEGTVCNDIQNRNKIRVSVAQNDRTPLDMTKAQWGGTIRKRTRTSLKGKECVGHEWGLTKQDEINKFFSDIEPFMIIPYKINQLKCAREKADEPWESKFKCNFCEKVYSDPSGRRRHEKKEHVDIDVLHTCDICQKPYKSKDSMNRHKRLNHKPDTSPPTGRGGQDNSIAGSPLEL
jgi:hypothetical protein